MDAIEKYRAFYARKPCSPLFMKEFGFFTLDKWKKQGYIDDNTDLNELFGFDKSPEYIFEGLGWCEAAFEPFFEEKTTEDLGDKEVVRDAAGRKVLYYKERREGYMPEYIDHPVKDIKTWEEDVKWRLNPDSPQRYKNLSAVTADAKAAKSAGKIISQQLIGGYMYLRSLIGPVNLLFTFYDQPGLIHECMKTWLDLSDKIIEKHQKIVSLDELFFSEDICYNSSSLISPDMIKEFLFPYYAELIKRTKNRQKGIKLHLQLDTDGKIGTVLNLYRDIGFDYFSPFEAAAGNDVVKIRKAYPEILISGGFDKRILLKGKDAIDREVDRIMPFMYRRGGYIPTCDHGVPEETEFDNYFHFRRRLLEFSR